MDKERFKLKSKQYLSGGVIKIILDKETGVNYIVNSGLGLSGMTPLLDNKCNIIVDKINDKK